MLIRKQPTGPTHAGLDLIQDQEQPLLITQFPEPGEIVIRGYPDPSLCLDWLNEDRDRFGRDRLGDRAEIIKGDISETREHRLKIFLVLGLASGRERPHGPAVEGMLHRNDLK